MVYQRYVSSMSRLSSDREYEVRQLEVFLEMVKKGTKVGQGGLRKV